MDQINGIQMNKEEVSLKDLFRQFQTCLKLLRQNILLTALIAFLFGSLGFSISFFSEPKYKAELRFVVKSEGASSGLNGMLGGLGSVLGGSSMGLPLERTVEIASSDRIIGAALLSEVRLFGKNEVLANSLIRINKLHKAWDKDSL